jgi:hypothetical protein
VEEVAAAVRRKLITHVLNEKKKNDRGEEVEAKHLFDESKPVKAIKVRDKTSNDNDDDGISRKSKKPVLSFFVSFFLSFFLSFFHLFLHPEPNYSTTIRCCGYIVVGDTIQLNVSFELAPTTTTTTSSFLLEESRVEDSQRLFVDFLVSP